MIPSALTLSKIGPAVAAQADTFAPAEDPNKVVLLSGDFSPNNSLLLADLTQVTSNGLTAIELVEGAQLESFDPGNGDILIEMKSPLGGLRFETSSEPTDPLVITGYAVINNAGTALIGCDRLPQSVTLSLANQSITIPPITMRIPRSTIR